MKPKKVSWKWIMDQHKRGFMGGVSGYTMFMFELQAFKQRKAEEERLTRLNSAKSATVQ